MDEELSESCGSDRVTVVDVFAHHGTNSAYVLLRCGESEGLPPTMKEYVETAIEGVEDVGE